MSTDKVFFNTLECPEPVEGRFFVYILQCRDLNLYCGCTNNLVRRLADHNKGIAARYTRARVPARLIYYETHDSLLSSRRREAQIKNWSRVKKLKLVIGVWSKP